MNPSGIALFDLAERRLDWAGRRQEVLSQNIANADTPGWRGQDIVPFATQLSASVRAAVLAITQPGHLAPRDPGPSRVIANQGERAPDGNGIALDVELSKVADTESVHALASNLYGKYLTLFRIAAGR